jgi:hypothetical protein
MLRTHRCIDHPQRNPATGRVYICDGGALGSITLRESFTDRRSPPTTCPLTVEVLIDLAEIVSALQSMLTVEKEDRNLV